MEDADRHDQIEALSTLKELLDKVQDNPDITESDVRDAAIRAVNTFDASIAKHDSWRRYEGLDAEAAEGDGRQPSESNVEYHPEYPGRLRRRLGTGTAHIAIPEAALSYGNVDEWTIKMRLDGPWTTTATVVGSCADAMVRAARELLKLREPTTK